MKRPSPGLTRPAVVGERRVDYEPGDGGVLVALTTPYGRVWRVLVRRGERPEVAAAGVAMALHVGQAEAVELAAVTEWQCPDDATRDVWCALAQRVEPGLLRALLSQPERWDDVRAVLARGTK